MKKLIFFCISSAILLFSIIVVNIAPIINYRLGRGGYLSSGAPANNALKGWSDNSCKLISDYYNIQKEKDITFFGTQEIKDKQLEDIKKKLNKCNRKQAMAGLEISVFNINIIFGTICSFLGLLLYLETINIGKKVGLIGLGCGGIGFILTLVYAIESGLIFNDVADENDEPRVDSDGAILEWNSSKNRYTCIFYEKDNEDSLKLKYSDYGISYLNYRKDIFFLSEEKNHEYNGCRYTYTTFNHLWNFCVSNDEDPVNNSNQKTSYFDINDSTKEKGKCNKIYYFTTTSTNEKKILYDCWLTTIILSCFIILLSIGLAIFGFLLFKESNSSSGSVAIK